MEKLRKSFNQNHQKSPEEERQILLNSARMTISAPFVDSGDHKDTVIKIDGKNTREGSAKENELVSQSNNGEGTTGNRIWRDSSYDFTKDAAARVAGEFDFVSESPVSQRSPLSRIAESDQVTPREVRVSFNEAINEPVRRRSSASCEDDMVVMSSGSSFRRKSTLLKTKTKSRMMDPPEQELKSGRLMRSGIIAKSSEIEDDDPFLEEDLPDDYKRLKYSTLTLVQLMSLILIVGALVCSLTVQILKRRTIFELELWKWELMVLVLICGRLVSGWGIRIIVFFIERNFLLRKRVLYFVYGLRNAVQNCIWLTLVLIAWQCIFDKKVERMTAGKVLPYVTKMWVCLLVGTMIWLLKTLLVKVLASSFHVSTFFDRIHESLFNQYVIEALSGLPRIEIQQEQEEEDKLMAEVQNLQNAGATIPADLKATVLPRTWKSAETPRKSPTSAKSQTYVKSPMFSRALSGQDEEGISIEHLHRLNQKNISAWNMKRLMNIVRKGVMSTLDEQLKESTGEDESALQITSENQAKAAAKKIFCNVAKPGSKHIHLEDLMRFMRDDEATKTMRLFEGTGEGKGISKRSLKNWVVNAFRERRALALSLNDTKTAVNKLHQMLNVVVGIVIVVLWLLILKVASTHFFIFLSSQLLLVVFVFGNTCKTTFEAIIFLFVMHPFDVGDRIELDEIQMVVEEMNILTTVFLRYDNQKIIYPNSVLATKPISNYYRSPDMGDAIDFCIHISTPTEKIALMKERITRYIENKSDYWYPAPMIVMRDVEDMNRVKFSVWLSHTMNHQDMGERWARRSILVEEMVRIFKDLDIEYRMLPLDINVRNMPPLTSNRQPSVWALCN